MKEYWANMPYVCWGEHCNVVMGTCICSLFRIIMIIMDLLIISTVAAYVGNGYSHSQCLHRWFNSTNPTIKKGRWSKEEDEARNGYVHGACAHDCSCVHELVHLQSCVQ